MAISKYPHWNSLGLAPKPILGVLRLIRGSSCWGFHRVPRKVSAATSNLQRWRLAAWPTLRGHFSAPRAIQKLKLDALEAERAEASSNCVAHLTSQSCLNEKNFTRSFLGTTCDSEAETWCVGSGARAETFRAKKITSDGLEPPTSSLLDLHSDQLS